MSESSTPEIAPQPGDPPPVVELRDRPHAARALALGAWANHFYWSGSQAWLCGSSSQWARSRHALDTIFTLLQVAPKEPRVKAINYLRRAWHLLTRKFNDKQFMRNLRSFNFGLHLRRVGSRRFETTVLSGRITWLNSFLQPAAPSRLILGALPTREGTWFELGEVIDEGVRPPLVHQFMRVPTEAPLLTVRVPRYLGERCALPGEFVPEWSWGGRLERRWLAAIGTPLDDTWIRRHQASDADQRCALVGELMKCALRSVDLDPIPTDGRSPSPTDVVGESPFPLTFPEGSLTIVNAQQQAVCFQKDNKPYQFARRVYECALRGCAATDDDVDAACWGQGKPGGIKEARSNAKSRCNSFLMRIGCEVYRGKNGYVIGKRFRAPDGVSR